MKLSNQPIVSVVIPVYNAEAYLEECLHSVINQTIRNIEIICIDDASSDNSVNVIKGFAEKDDRIKLFCLKENVGAGGARNIGLDNSHGTYLYFLDADDFLELNALMELVEKIQSVNSDIVVFDYWEFDSETRNPAVKIYQFQRCHIDQIKKDPFSVIDFTMCFFQAFGNVVWNKLFRKELIVKNHIRFQNVAKANDMYFSWKSMLSATSITTLKKKLIHYRRNVRTSITVNLLNELYPFAVYNGIKEILIQKNLYRYLKQSFDNLVISLIMCNLRCAKDKIGKYYNIVKNEWFISLNLLGLDASWFFDRNLFYEYKLFIDSKNSYEFIINNTYLMNDIISQMASEYERLSDEHEQLLDLSRNHWSIIENIDKMMQIEKGNIGIEQYFLKKGYKKIGVYGLGYIGRYFLEIVKKTSIDVSYVIDRSAQSESYIVYTPESKFPEVDAIIVTAVYYFEEIEDTLLGKVNCRIISLEEVLNSI